MSRTNDEQKKKYILAKLVIKSCIGGKYTPKENTYGQIPKEDRGNLDQLLDELKQENLIIYHKGKSCISINPKAIGKIKKMLKDDLPDFYLDKL